MNKTSRFCLLWLIISSTVSQMQIAFAQGSGSAVCSNYNGPLVNSFSSWDWTLPTSDSRYCQMWAALLTTPSTPSGTLVIGAPWERAASGVFYNMARDKDYTREKGWELLRMDFGAYQRIKVPYFYLYNRYSGIIRTFFWLDLSLGTFQSGVSVTMSHISNSRHSGILALSNKIVKSQDYYLSSSALNTEAITYVCEFTQQTGWVVADFQTGFDSYSSNQNYNGTALQFDVAGVVTTTLKGKGDFNFKTDNDIAKGGYAIGGAGTTTSTGKQFFADTKKVFSIVASDELTGVIDNFIKKADATTSAVPLPAVQAKVTPLVQAASSQSASPFKQILGILGSVDTAFGIMDTIIGAIWPDNKSSPSKATLSNGTLNLTGVLETRTPVFSRTMQIPGTQHVSNTNTQSYYNCPLGIFNMENTPVLNKMGYDYVDGEYTVNYAPGTQYAIKQYESYQVSNDLRAVYNEAAGLSLESVQASIVAKSATSEFNFVRNYRTLPGYTGGGPYADVNFMHQEVITGEIEVINANQDTVTCSTPFIDLANFKNQAITVPLNSKVYVRVKAVLKQKGNSGSSPIYYVQDYAVQSNPTTIATNPRYRAGWPLREPPFTNLASQLIGPLWTGPTNQLVTDFTSPYARYPYVVKANTYSVPIIYSSLSPIEAGTGPNFSTSATFPYAPSGIVTIDHPNSPQASMFLSTIGIALGEGFSVTPGTNFIAATPLQAHRTGGSAIINSFSGLCSYNTAADRLAMLATSETVTIVEGIGVYPNPTDGKVTITSTLLSSDEGLLTILDYMGREISAIGTVRGGKQQIQLDLSGYQAGLYMVSLKTKGKAFTQKLLIK